MFGNLGKMMKMAGELREKMPELQEKLANAEYTAEAGDGMVSATVNGKLKVVRIRLDREKIDAAGDVDYGMLEDLIAAAVSSAQDDAAQTAQEAMSELTGGLPLPPGLGL